MLTEKSAALEVVGLTDLPVVCMSNIKHGALMQRPQQIMHHYCRFAPVLYVEPPTYPGPLSLFKLGQTALRAESAQLWTMSTPMPFPLGRTLPPVDKLNHRIVSAIILSRAKRLGFDDFCLWYYRYDLVEFGRPETVRLLVYDCVDDWAGFWQPDADAEERERNLIKKSDVVFVTSQRLFDMKRKLNPHTYLVPNGVEFEHFSLFDRPPNLHPVRLEGIHRPVIGFQGMISSWLDLETIETVAKKRPDWSFVMVGPISPTVKLPAHRNIHHLGEVSYAELPSYLAEFDVCLIPFKRTRMTDSVNPIKLYEYLATGKPIVSSDLPEVRQFSSLIEIADGAVEFEEAINRALQERSLGPPRARVQIASENSWQRRVSTIRDILGQRVQEMGIRMTKASSRG